LRNILPFYSASNLVKKSKKKKAQLAYLLCGLVEIDFGIEENIISFQDCGATRNNASLYQWL
jgi:hypothetical protein